MKPGDEIVINAQILRVEGTRIAAQTADGQLIRTERFNVEIKPVNLPEHKAIVKTTAAAKSKSRKK